MDDLIESEYLRDFVTDAAPAVNRVAMLINCGRWRNAAELSERHG